MKAFIKFIIKYHFTLIFLLLQFISFLLIVSFNTNPKMAFWSTANAVVGSFNQSISGINKYFSLDKENEKLVKENIYLRNKLLKNYKKNKITTQEIKDTSLYTQRYSLISARVIQASLYKENNYITIDKGKKHGVKEGDGVISSEGVVGVVRLVSDNYAVVLPLINKSFSLSCQLKKTHYLGSLIWLTTDYSKSSLLNIPSHIPIVEGDTLLTTGYSLIFPTGEYVGTISSFSQKEGESFYNIKVDLGVDFRSLSYVYVVNDLLKSELDTLQEKIND